VASPHCHAARCAAAPPRIAPPPSQQVLMDAWDEGVPATALREISVLKEVRHPHIVALEDVFVSYSGNLYLVFELLDKDLKQVRPTRVA
jgi:serine/threonine protein kinase